MYECEVSYENNEFQGFLALRFAFFAAFLASRSSDVKTDAPREESLVGVDRTDAETFALLMSSIIWGTNSDTNRFSYSG